LCKDLAAQLYQPSAAQQLGCAVCHVHKDRLGNLSARAIAIAADFASRTETHGVMHLDISVSDEVRCNSTC